MIRAVYESKCTLAACPCSSGSVSGESFGGVPDLLLITLVQKQHAWRKKPTTLPPPHPKHTHTHSPDHTTTHPALNYSLKNASRIMRLFCFPMKMLQRYTHIFKHQKKSIHDVFCSFPTEINLSILPHTLSFFFFLQTSPNSKSLMAR